MHKQSALSCFHPVSQSQSQSQQTEINKFINNQIEVSFERENGTNLINTM